ncbi:hypothetical protein PG993_011586 [Apiospora rasikravindrae]|uniref:Uncharacterized protein n=1 Tax=Apiospora rasikravindrae TaxID=990691 RepID=A0ABR1S017_9PEZI
MKSWKKLRKFLANPKARDAIVRNWKSVTTQKKRQRLRRGWEGKDDEKHIMPARHRQDFEGILSWKPKPDPKRNYEKEPLTLVELSQPSKQKLEEWKANLDGYIAEYAAYNAQDLSVSHGPLLELLFTRAVAPPSSFFESDREAEFRAFRGLYWPTTEDIERVKEWVDVGRGLQSGGGRGPLKQAEWWISCQSKIYEFAVDMCQKVGGDRLFQEVVGEEKPEDEEMADLDLGKRDWWPQPPDDDAADNEEALNAYLEECKRLQPFTHPEDINWEFLKRLADKRCRVARSFLQGMREDPAVFKSVLQEVWDRQPVDFETLYGMTTEKKKVEGTEVERLVLLDWPRKIGEFKRFEQNPQPRATTKLRDAIVTAVHQYECWSHIFRLIVNMQARYGDYRAYSDEFGTISPEFEVNFTTLHRLLNGLEVDLERRNQTLYYYLNALPEYQRYHRRVVQAPPLADFVEASRRQRAWPDRGGAKTEQVVNMLARINAQNGILGTNFISRKHLTEELLKYMEEQKMPPLPPLTQARADDSIAQGYMQLEFLANAYVDRVILYIARNRDENYYNRAEELLRKSNDLRALRYAGTAYFTTPWWQLVASMRKALNFDEYLRPEEIKTPEQRKANIEIENALAAFWDEFDKTIAGRDNNNLPDNTKALFEDAIPLTSVAEEDEVKETQPVVPQEPAPEEPKPELPQPPQQPTPEPVTPQPQPQPQPQQPTQPPTQPPRPPQPPRRRRTPREETTFRQRQAVEAMRRADTVEEMPPIAEEDKMEITKETERNKIPIANRRAWETLELLLGPASSISNDDKLQTMEYEEVKRMMFQIGYRAVTKGGNGSQVSFEPMEDLVKRGFTTALTYHRPHSGRQPLGGWRYWIWSRGHGLITKGLTFECFENVLA